MTPGLPWPTLDSTLFSAAFQAQERLIEAGGQAEAQGRRVDMSARSLPLLAFLLAGTVSRDLQALPSATSPLSSPAALTAAAAAAATASPWPKARTLLGLETLWEVPPGPLRGLLFVSHGCNQAATDWWPPSRRCARCLGLPENEAIRLVALRAGYALVAVSSHNRTSGCWHNTGVGRLEDLQVGESVGGGGGMQGEGAGRARATPALLFVWCCRRCRQANPAALLPFASCSLQRLPHVLRAVVQEERLGRLPLYALGVSSGGGIVLRLAQLMPEIKVNGSVKRHGSASSRHEVVLVNGGGCV